MTYLAENSAERPDLERKKQHEFWTSYLYLAKYNSEALGTMLQVTDVYNPSGTQWLCQIVGFLRKAKRFPGDSMVKNLPAKAGDMGLIPGLERSPRGRRGNPLQYSCLGNPKERGVWWATVPGVAKE